MKYYFIIACLLFNNPNCSLSFCADKAKNFFKQPSFKEAKCITIHPVICIYILSSIGFPIPIYLRFFTLLNAFMLLMKGREAVKTENFFDYMNAIAHFSSMLAGGSTLSQHVIINPIMISNTVLRGCVVCNLAIFIFIVIYKFCSEGRQEGFTFIAKEIIKIILFSIFFYLIYTLNLPRTINCIMLFIAILPCLKYNMYMLKIKSPKAAILLCAKVTFILGAQIMNYEEIFGAAYIICMMPSIFTTGIVPL